MGVPKFFRYTSERYPCLNELVKQYQIPEFDNMYLDMNGIIHNCSHPDDSNPHFRITEQKIFEEIFHYISILFQIIKPKKLFFMAIDGVAPRAKMNQQRGRRFRSAREAEQQEKKAIEKGEKLPEEKRFDSNCITPGTVFMARLHEQLRFFVKNKISTDPLWATCRIVLSGHETPGEGEHKIMDYIRWARSQPGYDANTRHCLYGLDADLVMLGMCTHEPHFALLREEVKFGKNTQRASSVEETNFYLLQLSLLREYLEQEFFEIKDKLPFKYDLEKIVDDWVLMGFLVGNDFIPNLPNMHISNDALPVLYKTYMAVLPKLDGYINEAGDLNLARFEIFMEELSKIDRDAFQETYADLKYFIGKTGSRPNPFERKSYKPNDDETFNVNVEDIRKSTNSDLQALISATESMFIGEDDELEHDGIDPDDELETSDEEANFNMEFKLHKKDYYMSKLDFSKVTDEVLRSQAECYVRAIQWNLYYYYKGCASWCWFYPHHYAPYISDIRGFKDLKIEFELGVPFKPFEQLLAVLPAASKHLLPEPFHELMTEDDSPIVHNYPVDFETDLNGKKNDWEAVVLIPFIDEEELLKAMQPCYARLTEEEMRRNTPGPMLIYDRTLESLGRAEAPEYFPPIADCHAKETRIWREELDLPPEMLIRGMLPNAITDLVYPGFPTTRHLKYTTYLEKKKVKVFDQPSRNENMIIKVTRDEDAIEDLKKYEHLLGKIVWVGWPHLTQAKVISVSNQSVRLHHQESTDAIRREENVGNMHQQWLMERSTIFEHHMNRLGIELGPVDVIVHAVNLKGYKYMVSDRSKLVLEPEWCTVPCGYPSFTVLTDISAHVVTQLTQFATPEELFKPEDPVFLLTEPYYGNLGKVVSSADTARTGRVRVSINEEPANVSQPTPRQNLYMNSHHAAAAVGISHQMLSRLTGTILLIHGQKSGGPTEQLPKINVGLNLKFNKKNLEVAGYTRRCPVANTWLYSQRCVDLVADYVRNFPELFDTISKNFGNDVYFESDIWPNAVGEGKPAALQEWLKQKPHAGAQKRPCGSDALEPEELLQLRTDQLSQLEEQRKEPAKVLTLQVKMTLLYKPSMHQGNLLPDPDADFQLYDRVICCSDKITVPLGAKGIITAVYNQNEMNTVRLSDKLNKETTYQVMFDEPFPGGMKEELIEAACFYRLSPCNMLNISYGRKIRPKEIPLSSTQSNHNYNSFENKNSFNKSKPYEQQNSFSQKNSSGYNHAQRNHNKNEREVSANFKNSENDVFTSFINQNSPSNQRPSSYSALRSQHHGMNKQVQNLFEAAAAPKQASPPMLLRREDGHNSAFACYSPTKEKQQTKTEIASQQWTRKDINPTTESSSQFLKNLLKISAADKNSNETEKEAAREKKISENWREGNRRNTIPSNKLTQPPVNWRTENRPFEMIRKTTIGNPRPPTFVGQQTNTELSSQNQTSLLGAPPPHLPPRKMNLATAPPAPLLPTPQLGLLPPFAQVPQLPLTNIPQALQHPPPALPQSMQPPPGMLPPPLVPQVIQQQPVMPPMPVFSSAGSQNVPFYQSKEPQIEGRHWTSRDTLCNPFVPLQAIANQRKNQHSNQTQPKAMDSRPPEMSNLSNTQVNQNQHESSTGQQNQKLPQSSKGKPQKKRKCRIGANLPVILD